MREMDRKDALLFMFANYKTKESKPARLWVGLLSFRFIYLCRSRNQLWPFLPLK